MRGTKFKYIIIILLAIFLFMPHKGLAKEYEISNYDFKIDVTDKGDYIITEEITYDFLEGSFSTAYREINNNQYQGLKFISLKGRDRIINERKVTDTETGLKINWEYPESSDQATFVLKYRAVGGLKATSDKNILTLSVIEEGWDVPIKDIDITIRFPQEINKTNLTPLEDIKINKDSIIKFHKNKIAPNSNYSIKVEFAKIMNVQGTKNRNYFMYIIPGLVIGLILALIDIINTYKARKGPAKTDLLPGNLNFINLANLYYPVSSQNRKGISAAVFALAQQKKIKLISKLDKKFFGKKDAEIKIDILSREGLSELQDKLITKLKEKDNLKKFMQDSKTANEILGVSKEKLIEKELLSEKALNLRKKFVFLGIFFIVLSIVSIIVGLLANLALLFSLASFLLIYGIGSLIKTAFLSVLSPKGKDLKEKIDNLLDQKKNNFEEMLKQDKEKALNMFFNELPYLVLHPKFNSSQLKKYKKQFKEVEDFQKPHWIDFDLSKLDKTLEALDAVEVIDYVLMSTIMVAAYTSAGAAGASGAGGGGAGGGGAA